MKRDTLKTLAGLIIIGGIVVATFLYGNAQRKEQLANDLEVKQQQAKSQEQSPAVSPSASAEPTATATATAKPSPTPTPTVVGNTAPVKSPTTNSLQGSGASGTALGNTTTPTPKASPSPTTPVAGGTSLPDTGPELIGLVGLGSITGMVVAVRGSRRAMLEAARRQR